MKLSKEQWMEHVAAFRKSGMRNVDYCKQHDLSPSAFGWHLNGGKERKKKKRLAQKSPKPKTYTNGHATGFVHVGAPDVIEVITKRGATLRIPITIGAHQLRLILEAVDE